MISLDLSVLVILGFLFILNIVLKKLLYEPVLTNLRHRRETIQTRQAATSENNRTVTQIEQEMKQLLSEAQRTARMTQKQVVEKARESAHSSIDHAADDLDKSLVGYRENVTESVSRIRQSLMPEIDGFAEIIRRRLLAIILVIVVAAAGGLISAATCRADTETDDAKYSENSENSEHSIVADLEKGLSFLIMSVGLFLLLRKPVSRIMITRIHDIQANLSESESDLKTSRHVLAEIRDKEKQVKPLIDEVNRKNTIETQNMLADLQQETQKQIQRIQAEGNRQKLAIESNAIRRLSHEMIAAALDKVEVEFTEGIDLETDRKLVRDCLEKLADLSVTQKAVS